ncbi:hypothetical protein N6B72_14865 [Chryseobacterium soli]|uniref:hypothetical protein n=1 Tax=Chryseobacterium soli TaxID=445961 RepID=UPI002953F051|nr:hypothetical protein [Chryseobacterium soli]MDV7698206.1 hypothetical protein [Chryseobacterium soli]
MDYEFYLTMFRSAAEKISKEQYDREGLKVSVDIFLESAVLKMYKPEWSGNPQSPLDAASRIFFSIWVSDKTIREGKMYYNIHALKLRELKDYKISSRHFAQNFRVQFLKHQKDWPNADIQYGPLTLMQGWIPLTTEEIQKEVCRLIQNFLEISPIIDIVLDQYKIR